MAEDKDLISVSGSAEIWRVHNKASNKIFIVKVVPLSLAHEQVCLSNNVLLLYKSLQIDSFVETVSAIHTSESPFISRFYKSEFDEVEECAHIYTEYLDAGSLDDIIQKKGPLPEDALREVNLPNFLFSTHASSA